jgi:hypothetical protein
VGLIFVAERRIGRASSEAVVTMRESEPANPQPSVVTGPAQQSTQFRHQSKALVELYNLIYSGLYSINGVERAFMLQDHP